MEKLRQLIFIFLLFHSATSIPSLHLRRAALDNEIGGVKGGDLNKRWDFGSFWSSNWKSSNLISNKDSSSKAVAIPSDDDDSSDESSGDSDGGKDADSGTSKESSHSPVSTPASSTSSPTPTPTPSKESTSSSKASSSSKDDKDEDEKTSSTSPKASTTSSKDKGDDEEEDKTSTKSQATSTSRAEDDDDSTTSTKPKATSTSTSWDDDDVTTSTKAQTTSTDDDEDVPTWSNTTPTTTSKEDDDDDATTTFKYVATSSASTSKKDDDDDDDYTTSTVLYVSTPTATTTTTSRDHHDDDDDGDTSSSAVKTKDVSSSSFSDPFFPWTSSESSSSKSTRTPHATSTSSNIFWPWPWPPLYDTTRGNPGGSPTSTPIPTISLPTKGSGITFSIPQISFSIPSVVISFPPQPSQTFNLPSSGSGGTFSITGVNPFPTSSISPSSSPSISTPTPDPNSVIFGSVPPWQSITGEPTTTQQGAGSPSSSLNDQNQGTRNVNVTYYQPTGFNGIPGALAPSVAGSQSSETIILSGVPFGFQASVTDGGANIDGFGSQDETTEVPASTFVPNPKATNSEIKETIPIPPLTGVTHKIQVSNLAGDLIFDPQNVKANPGDLIEWQFMYINWGTSSSSTSSQASTTSDSSESTSPTSSSPSSSGSSSSATPSSFADLSKANNTDTVSQGQGKTNVDASSETDTSDDGRDTRNWAVTQSDFWRPCQSLEGGFDSGFWMKTAWGMTKNVDVSSNSSTVVVDGDDDTGTESASSSATRKFTVMVVDDSPLWYFSRVVGDVQSACQAGMVGSINAPKKGLTYESFQKMAQSTATNATTQNQSNVSAASSPRFSKSTDQNLQLLMTYSLTAIIMTFSLSSC